MSELGKPGAAWADFMDARMRLIHEWADAGKSPAQIVADLNHHDAGQIRLLLAQHSDNAVPGSTRWQLQRLACLFDLLGVAHRYARRDMTQPEMSAEVADIIERLP